MANNLYNKQVTPKGYKEGGERKKNQKPKVIYLSLEKC